MSETFAIVVDEELDDRWAMQFEGLTITHDGNGRTRLYGPVVDQAALYGVLIRLNTLGMTLISVNRIDSPHGGSHVDNSVYRSPIDGNGEL